MQARLIHEVGTLITLRRYGPQYPGPDPQPKICPQGNGYYHNAEVEIERRDVVVQGTLHEIPVAAYRDDPRWPTQCNACGYVFTPEDAWQANEHRRYDTESGRPETGDLYWAGWGLDKATHHYNDATRHLYGITPAGDIWDIDGPSMQQGTNQFGPGWTRTGEPPAITVTPSILTIRYHGFLQQGQWTPDLDGRTYEHRAIMHG